MSTRQTLQRLRSYESRNVTYVEPGGSWPIVWEQARGMYVRDPEGRKYLDFTAAFGVAAAGHANPRIVRAGQRQMERLLHAMGDVHPHHLKADLARELSRLTFERWRRFGRIPSTATGKTIFCNSGFEAVEAALKTARLATGKPGVIAFEGAYHGLGYGTLNATHRAHFRSPFHDQLKQFGTFVPFPASGDLDRTKTELGRAFRKSRVGAILVEPIQVRGGIVIPPDGFLALLRRMANDHRAVLVFDEIYTGFGRAGTWFACEHERVVPDIICLGKALTGGFPLSACVGLADLMDSAWPPSTGEAIHTSTFLGHPVGCAMALAQINEIRSRDLVQSSARAGLYLKAALEKLAVGLHGNSRAVVRARGLLAGLDLRESDGAPATSRALALMKGLLQRGIIVLPEGEHSNVISFTPPLIVTRSQIDAVIAALRSLL